jgi:hypothetical protein
MFYELFINNSLCRLCLRCGGNPKRQLLNRFKFSSYLWPYDKIKHHMVKEFRVITSSMRITIFRYCDQIG